MALLAVPSLLGAARAAAVTTTPRYSCVVGSDPQMSAFDPVNHDIYVPNYGSQNLSVVSSRCSLVATVSFKGSRPSAPTTAVYDPLNDFVYVSDQGYGGGGVHVLKGTRLVKNVSLGRGNGEVGMTFDPRDGFVLVVEQSRDAVAVINGTRLVGTFPVQNVPVDVAVDPVSNTILITNYGSSSVTINSNASDPLGAPETNISLTSRPAWVAFDPSNDLDYVSYQKPGLVAAGGVVIMDGNGTILRIASTSIGIPAGVTYSGKQSLMYAFVEQNSTGHAGAILELNTTGIVRTLKIPGLFPVAGTFDQSNGLMYVTSDATPSELCAVP